MTTYALLYAKNAAEGVLFNDFRGNAFIAQNQYYYAIAALIEQGSDLELIQPRPYGGTN